MLQNDEVQTGRYSPPLSPRCHTVSSIQSLLLYKAFVLLPPKRLLPLSGFLQSAPHTCSGTPGCCPSKHPHEVPPMPPLEEMYSKNSVSIDPISHPPDPTPPHNQPFHNPSRPVQSDSPAETYHNLYLNTGL